MSSVKRYTEDGAPILQPDGFRKRRKRHWQWEAKAMREGVIPRPFPPGVTIYEGRNR